MAETLPLNLKWHLIARSNTGLGRHFRFFRAWAVRQPNLAAFTRTPEVGWLLCRPWFTVTMLVLFVWLLVSSVTGTLYGLAALVLVWSISNRFFSIALMTLFVAFVLPAIVAAFNFVVEGFWILLPLALFLWVRFFVVAAPIPVKIDDETRKKLKSLR